MALCKPQHVKWNKSLCTFYTIYTHLHTSCFFIILFFDILPDVFISWFILKLSLYTVSYYDLSETVLLPQNKTTMQVFLYFVFIFKLNVHYIYQITCIHVPYNKTKLNIIKIWITVAWLWVMWVIHHTRTHPVNESSILQNIILS